MATSLTEPPLGAEHFDTTCDGVAMILEAGLNYGGVDREALAHHLEQCPDCQANNEETVLCRVCYHTPADHPGLTPGRYPDHVADYFAEPSPGKEHTA